MSKGRDTLGEVVDVGGVGAGTGCTGVNGCVGAGVKGGGAGKGGVGAGSGGTSGVGAGVNAGVGGAG